MIKIPCVGGKSKASISVSGFGRDLGIRIVKRWALAHDNYTALWGQASKPAEGIPITGQDVKVAAAYVIKILEVSKFTSATVLEGLQAAYLEQLEDATAGGEREEGALSPLASLGQTLTFTAALKIARATGGVTTRSGAGGATTTTGGRGRGGSMPCHSWVDCQGECAQAKGGSACLRGWQHACACGSTEHRSCKKGKESGPKERGRGGRR